MNKRLNSNKATNGGRIANEKNVDIKTVPSLLKELGYSENDWEAGYPIPAGRTTVFADFIVSSSLNDTENAINLIIDSKKDDENLESFIRQVVSYGRLVKAKYSILLNSTDYIAVDNNNGAKILEGSVLKLSHQFTDIFSKSNYFCKNNIVEFSSVQISEAKNILIVIEDIKKFNKVLTECQDIIRDCDGLTGSDAFDELSKVLFIKIYLENQGNSSVFTQAKMDENVADGVDWTNVQFENVKKEYSLLFSEDDLISLSRKAVYAIVGKLEKYDFKNTNVDIKGNAYEILLGKTFLGALGQHFTPRTVVDFMLNMINPAGMMSENYIPTVMDPSCGTGGFLVRCLETYLDKANMSGFSEEAKKKIREETIFGIDLNPRSAKVTKMNMSLHGDGHGCIFAGNGLLPPKGLKEKKYDIVLTNPPFGVSIKDEDILKLFKAGKDKQGKVKTSADSTYLFAEHCIDILNENGKLGILLPNGILNNSSDTSHREHIIKNISIDAMISLPSRSFKFAKANACTGILFGTKSKDAESNYVFMAIPEEIGYERVTQYAKEIKQNDLIQILKMYKDFCENKTVYKNKTDETVVLCKNPAVFLLRKDLLIAKRFDASYYYSEYVYKNVISENCVRLSEYAKLVKRELGKISIPIKYVETSNIVPSIGSICDCSIIESDDKRPSRAKLYIKSKEILAARMMDCEKNVAIVSEQYDNSLATNGFLHIVPIPPMTTECLYYLLKSDFNSNQIRYKSSNTIMPSIYDYEYMNNWMPKLTAEQIQNITDKIKKSISSLQNAINGFDAELSKKLY